MAKSGLNTAITDAQLVKRVLEGDAKAFEDLFHRYQALVYRQAWSLVGNHEQAEDMVQEVFTTAYQNLDRLRDPVAIGKWLCTITRNRCINMLRKKKVKTISLDRLSEVGFEPAMPPAEEDLNSEQMALIRQLLSKLPLAYQEIVHLRYNQDFSYQKLADYLDISMGAVKSRLFHARQALIALLGKEGQQ